MILNRHVDEMYRISWKYRLLLGLFMLKMSESTGNVQSLLTLSIYAQVYRFLAPSPAYRLYKKIYCFASKYVPCSDR